MDGSFSLDSKYTILEGKSRLKPCSLWERGKALRKRPSCLEKKLEQIVIDILKPFRKTKHPLRYCTNMPLHGYIPDIYIEKIRLAIEADGPHHESTRARAHDSRRDAFLRQNGVTVIRFSYMDLKNTERVYGILERIIIAKRDTIIL